jgi:hypothetical protein
LLAIFGPIVHSREKLEGVRQEVRLGKRSQEKEKILEKPRNEHEK